MCWCYSKWPCPWFKVTGVWENKIWAPVIWQSSQLTGMKFGTLLRLGVRNLAFVLSHLIPFQERQLCWGDFICWVALRQISPLICMKLCMLQWSLDLEKFLSTSFSTIYVQRKEFFSHGFWSIWVSYGSMEYVVSWQLVVCGKNFNIGHYMQTA